MSLVRRELLCFCGPSGVGKGTIVNLLLQDFETHFGFSVSHTTRPRREGEVDGKHYHFMSIESMMQEIKSGAFAEHAQVHGNLYGTTFMAIDSVHQINKICLLDLDLNGVRGIKVVAKKHEMNVRCIGIVPSTYKVLEERLRSRRSENELEIQQRMARAVEDTEFCEQSNTIDYLLVNFNSYEYGYPKVRTLIKHWYPWIKDGK